MTARTAKTSDAVLTQTITREVAKRVVGQEVMVERLLIGLLTGGHILLEGVPGLAKTLAVKTVAECLRISFSRIQFTPDLLPADVIGTMVFDQRTQEFYPKKGPLFANLILADEINRAPREPQSVGLAELKALIAFGASPRASIFLAQAARAHAYLRGRAFVVPEDVKAMAYDVLRHRVLLTFEAEAEDVDADQVIGRILEAVGVP